MAQVAVEPATHARRAPMRRALSRGSVILAMAGLALSLVALYWAIGNAGRARGGIWFTSDTLYPVNVTTDILRDGFSLSGWRFSIAPCWFPDLFAAGFFWVVTHNAIIATLLAGFIQLPLMIFGFEIARKAIGVSSFAVQTVTLCGVSIAIALYVASRPGQFHPDVYKLFLPQSHAGGLVLSVFALALGMLWIRFTHDGKRPPRLFSGSYAAVCLLAGMSNLMFFPQMLLPFAAAIGVAAFFGVLAARDCWRPLAAGFAAAVVGAALNRVLFHTTDLAAESEISQKTILDSLDVFTDGAASQLLHYEQLHVLAALWVIICLAVVAFTLRKMTHSRREILRAPERFLFLFCCFWLFSVISCCGAVVFGGSYGLSLLEDYVWTTHYLQSVFLLPLFGIPLLACWKLGKFVSGENQRTALMAGSAAVLMIAPAVCLTRTGPPQTPLASYRPPLVQFLDSIAPTYGLRYGLAGYWQSRQITLLSTQGLRAYAINGGATPYLWANNSQWYTEAVDDHRRRPPLDFVVLDDREFNIQREPVVAFFGEPVHELRFQRTRVLIYAGGHPDLSRWPPPPQIRMNAPLMQFSQRITSSAKNLCGNPGGGLSVPIVITNTGVEAWASAGKYPTNLSYRWLDSGHLLDVEGIRTALPRTLNAGESILVMAHVDIPAFAPAHALTLRFSMVQEGIAWFFTHGAQTLDIPVQVNGCWPARSDGHIPVLEVPRKTRSR